MRPLTEEEAETFFKKLTSYIGDNVAQLIQRPEERYCFLLHHERVYYVSDSIKRKAACVGRDELLSLGICMGKFTKTKKFKLQITALEILSPHAKYKLWIKPNGEMPFLYGNHVLKAHLGKITEDTPEHQGIVIYNMADYPLGFGVCARASAEMRKLDPTAIIAFRQADVGEYLRHEDTLT